MLTYAPHLHARPGYLQWNADAFRRGEYRAFRDPILKPRARWYARETIVLLSRGFPIVTAIRATRSIPNAEIVKLPLFPRFARCLSLKSVHIAKSLPGRDDKVSNARRVPSKPTGFQSFSLHVYGFMLADRSYPRGSRVTRGLRARDPWPPIRFREVVRSQFLRTSFFHSMPFCNRRSSGKRTRKTDTEKRSTSRDAPAAWLHWRPQLNSGPDDSTIPIAGWIRRGWIMPHSHTVEGTVFLSN